MKNDLVKVINHSEANNYRKLCNIAGDVIKNVQTTLPNGYKVIDKEKGDGNFKSVAYEKDNKIVVCFIGTDVANLSDHSTNLEMFFSDKPTRQMEKANEFYKKIKINYSKNNEKQIVLIGHSEGGTEATYVGLINNIPTVTFNALGINKKLRDSIEKENGKRDYNSILFNYRDPHDIISKIVELDGNNYVVDSEKNNFVRNINPYGTVLAHRISNFGDCKNALDVETYKKENKFFINNLKEIIFTNKDIGNMEPETFSAIQTLVINPRLQNNEILNILEAQFAADSGKIIYVESYLRSDGTRVRGYYRHA